MTYTLHLGDCLDILPTLDAGSVDAVIADPPYGTTACRWDSVIPFAPMWEGIKHVIKQRGAVALFGSQPFTSALVMSNAEWFKYEWIWEKDKSTGHLDAWKRPMKKHENILVFCEDSPIYNPQITKKPKENIRPNPNRRFSPVGEGVYGAFGESNRTIGLDETMPQSVVRFNTPNHGIRGMHPTQKPVALLEYLIRTYTNPGDTVLDFTFGSCTTGVACLNTERNFVGIEKDEKYFEIGKKRMEDRVAYLTQIGSIPLSYDKTDKDKSNYQARSLFEYQQILEMGGYDEPE